ncbi:MAG: ABC transporter permease [Elusimicrobiota bacterium]
MVKKSFMYSRCMAVAGKEVMHILRDPFTIAIAIIMPIVLVTYFGFAIDFNFKNIKLAVYDSDNSRLSRELLRTFYSSGYFVLNDIRDTANPILEVESERSDASLIIKPGFGRKMIEGRNAGIQLLVDGSDNMKAGVISGYLAGIHKSFLAGARSYPGERIKVKTRFLYNPELNTRWFVVPGLIVVLAGLLGILLTSLTIAREWENGSMELLLSTPVTPLEIVTGKILPYIVLQLVGIAFVFLTARSVFYVPFRGSYTLFAITCIVFITATLAQGIMISVITRQQQKAMQMSILIGLLPSLLLSGFIFPIESMPVIFKYITALLPPRWFMVIIRGLFLKGTGIAELALPVASLITICFVLVAAAAGRLKKDLEP